ncbi:hypothetical protein BpHYR1_005833 [Brachionus plicatilis]|uniref:Uncharacterized protein n=1 Tax=Brachionus plicatilis TaxID=10195 RepID=A0A3M7PNS6_BRAPC|nr:hypothetical protein BpHYR1_005833 [Brachionus plicatilis]
MFISASRSVYLLRYVTIILILSYHCASVEKLMIKYFEKISCLFYERKNQELFVKQHSSNFEYVLELKDEIQ